MIPRLITTSVLLVQALTAGLWAANDSLTTEEILVKDLKVILKRQPTSAIVTVQLYWKGGAMKLTESTQGIEPFILNSTQLDAKKFTEKNWNKLLQGTGAQLGTRVEKDFTVVSLRCIREYFDDLWELYADYILDSNFYDERVEVTREQMLTQIRQRKDNPDVYLRDLADAQFFANHPYELNPSGTEDSIKKINMKQMKSYVKDELTKTRLLLVVVGNVDRDDLVNKVSETFAKLKDGDGEVTFPPKVTQTRPFVKVEERELETNYILGLFAAPNLNDGDYFPMAIAVDLLKWRLFEEVRTKRNLSYAPDAFLATNFANYGGVYATTDNPDSTVKVMIKEIRKLCQDPLSEKDVRDRINIYITRHYMEHESGAAQARLLAQLELSGLGWQAEDTIVARLRSVTAEDVQRVANRYFKHLQFVYLGNPDLIDEALFTTL